MDKNHWILIKNLFVIKENQKTFWFYNTDFYFWNKTCYLEKYFLKQNGLTIEKINSSFDNLIKSWKIDNKFLEHSLKPLKQYERLSDYEIKSLIELMREDLWLPNQNLNDKLDILSEIAEEINSFSFEELNESYDKLNVESIIDNPEVDDYIKSTLKSIANLKWDNKQLENINKIKDKTERLDKKKNFLKKFKEIWKKTLLGWILSISLVWMFWTPYAWAVLDSSDYDTSSSDSRSSRSKPSSSSDSRNSRSSPSSSSSDSRKSSSSRDSRNSSTTVSTPSWSRDTLSDKTISLSRNDISISEWTMRFQTYWVKPISLNDISGVKASIEKKWDDDYVHYTQDNIHKYWSNFSTSWSQDYYVVSSFWESLRIDGSSINYYDSVYIKMNDWTVYRIREASNPSYKTIETTQNWVRNKIDVTNLNVENLNNWLKYDLSNIKGVMFSSRYDTTEKIPNKPDTYTSSNNTVYQYSLKKINYNDYSYWEQVWTNSSEIKLNINDTFIWLSINWYNLKGGEHLRILTQDWKTFSFKAEEWDIIEHYKVNDFSAKDWMNNFSIKNNEIKSLKLLRKEGEWLLNFKTNKTIDFYLWNDISNKTSSKEVEININEDVNSVTINWKTAVAGDEIKVEKQDWEIITLKIVSKMTETTKKIFLGILVRLGAWAMFYFLYWKFKVAVERTRNWKWKIDEEEIDKITKDILNNK